VVHYLHQEKVAKKLAALIQEMGTQALAVRADLQNKIEIAQMSEKTLKRWGKINVLINNASIVSDQMILHMTEKNWDQVISVNLTGTFKTIQAIAPSMVKQRFGHIINISSYTGAHGRSGQSNYSASKAGVMALTKTAALELGSHNILVNTVIPGFLEVGMGNKMTSKQIENIRRDFLLSKSPPIQKITEFIYTVAMMEGVSGQIFNLDSRILY
jgi:3-oxoacyl-[acyl-carrier protein] reductase